MNSPFGVCEGEVPRKDSRDTEPPANPSKGGTSLINKKQKLPYGRKDKINEV